MPMNIEAARILPIEPRACPRAELSVPAWAVGLCSDRYVTGPLDVKASGARGVLTIQSGPHHSLVSATLGGVTSLCTSELQQAVHDAYLAVLGALKQTPTPHAVRMWNFIADIHQPMGPEVDRYRVFNAARFDAFAAWFGAGSAQAAARFAGVLPAASGVGHSADELSIHALGAFRPGVTVENPLQIPAFDYSPAHGPRPPCFSRAVIAELGAQPGRATLLVSGTASIRGEDSTHGDDVAAQFDETIENIARLAASVRSPRRFGLAGVETARVYYVRAADCERLESAMRLRVPASARVEMVQAAICRRELLVEIEATIAATDSESLDRRYGL